MGKFCFVWFLPSKENFSLKNSTDFCVSPMIFCDRCWKRSSKRILGKTSLSVLCINSLDWQKVPSATDSKSGCYLMHTPFMVMFSAPLKLSVYFPVLTYDREFDLLWSSKMGVYRVQKPMLICFPKKWTCLWLKTGGRIHFSGGTFALAPH